MARRGSRAGDWFSPQSSDDANTPSSSLALANQRGFCQAARGIPAWWVLPLSGRKEWACDEDSLQTTIPRDSDAAWGSISSAVCSKYVHHSGPSASACTDVRHCCNSPRCSSPAYILHRQPFPSVSPDRRSPPLRTWH